MTLFAIPAVDIDAAGRSIEADLPVEWLDKQLAEAEVQAVSPGHMSVRLSRSGSDIIVRGRAHVTLNAPCGRCLSPAKLEIEGDLSLLLQPARTPATAPAETKAAHSAAPKGKGAAPSAAASASGGKVKKAAKEKDLPEYEFMSEEADVDTYDGETVVLDDFVREAILLEMPIFPLCSEACPGIAPASCAEVDGGEASRVDPRLAPLGALRAALAQSKAGNESNDESGARPRSDASHRKKTK